MQEIVEDVEAGIQHSPNREWFIKVANGVEKSHLAGTRLKPKDGVRMAKRHKVELPRELARGKKVAGLVEDVGVCREVRDGPTDVLGRFRCG